LATGQRIRVLTAIDYFTRECVCLEAGFHLPAPTVTATLDQAIARRAAPQIITCDNGSEFTSSHVDAWADRRKIRLDFIAPGRPIENTYIESFNGKLRDECLSEHWFVSLDEARTTLAAWREEYNKTQPHSSLDDLPPEVFAARWLAVAGA
jgi:putative transposase